MALIKEPKHRAGRADPRFHRRPIARLIDRNREVRGNENPRLTNINPATGAARNQLANKGFHLVGIPDCPTFLSDGPYNMLTVNLA